MAGCEEKDRELVLEVEGVSKVYQLWRRPIDRLKYSVFRRGAALAELFSSASRVARELAGARDALKTEFYALRNVSLQVHKGEVLGIVGRNGSGKSTLLQVIAGTLRPTSGSVKVYGKVAALLELGSGFNPEYTGRENIFMNAAILGLSPRDVERRMEEILSFADIGTFVDQPLKTYSSGMVVRLAFAVQVAMEPEVLIVDEALAVGDEAFQRKCFARLEELKEKGTTILLVTHDTAKVVSLCSRAILLDHGEKLVEGSPKNVVAIYHKLLYGRETAWEKLREEFHRLEARTASSPSSSEAQAPARADWTHSRSFAADDGFFDPNLVSQSVVEYPAQEVRIEDPHLETLEGKRVNHLRRGREYVYTYQVCFRREAWRVRFGSLLKTVEGVALGGMVSHSEEEPLPYVGAGEVLEVRFRFRCHLVPGVYFLNAGVVARGEAEEEFLHRLIDVVVFRVLPEPALRVNSYVDFLEEVTIRLLSRGVVNGREVASPR
jgi:lipopolysaccharide transport system ATP-binding protein